MRQKYKKSPLVSIGIPTYKRPALLRRALRSIVNQSYDNYEIIISNNDPNDNEVEVIVEEIKALGAVVTYERQKTEVSPTENFFNCLKKANGDFFMWLADDDEIADHGYIKNLAKILIDNPSASSACANWLLMKDIECGENMGVRDYKSRFWFLRVIKFTLFSVDDFFYALHRTELLRNASGSKYFWPNRGTVVNWAYPFLMDMVIQGEVIGTDEKNILWINHNYTSKGYSRNNDKKLYYKVLMSVSRRINVHFLYFSKVRKSKGAFYGILLVPVSLLSLVLEGARIINMKFKLFSRL